ncbi:MAG TPA: lamin tail domain-containing protein [Acidimicrobiia bacterium]
MLAGLRVAPEGARTGYSRDLFPLWIDADHNGCDTREEVLIAESRTKAQVDRYGCKVVAGDWYSLYDGLTFTDPAELDIDHMVPLAEAWDSGASAWTTARRQAYANDLDHPQTLRAVSASANRSKGDLDPGQWKPTNEAAWCEYANDWVSVKKTWDLTADENEVDDLKVMLRTCTGAPGSPTTATTVPPPSPTTTTRPPASGGAVAISALDCQGEAVTVANGGGVPADLTGWSIHDDGANHTYRFSAGYTLAPGASVTVRSGGPAHAGELAWTNQNVWNNTGDTASLVNAGGGVVSTRSC